MPNRTELVRWVAAVGEWEGVIFRISLLERVPEPRLEGQLCGHLAERNFGQREATGMPRGASGRP